MNLQNSEKFFYYIFYLWWLVNLAVAQPAQKNITTSLNILKYTLNIITDLENDQFNGTVDIDISVKSENKLGTSLVLDSEGLTITDVSLQDSTSVKSLGFDTSTYNITIKLQEPLKTNTFYKISINFFGKMQSGGTGIIKYTANNSTYVTTNFYPFYARKAFPCFNDVFIKSVFSLTINTNQKDLKVLSNMPIEHSDLQGTLYQFKDTPKIPIYGLFFTVGSYAPSNAASNVYVPKNSISFNAELNYVLKNMEYQAFLNITKSPALRMVAVPGLPITTFTAYNIIAIREDNLFFNLKRVTTEQRKTSLLDIFGATYKMFYGSYLTPKNWNDSWLVESIPIYLKYNGLSEVSEWGDPTDYITHDIQQTVLKLNSRPDSLPVVYNNFKTENDVLNFINGPTMLKGAGILTMLESVLTKDILIDVLLDYYSDSIRNKSGIASTDDFITFLSKHEEVLHVLHNVNIEDILKTWLKQGGYPYLQTKRAGNGIVIDQGVFIEEVSTTQNIQPWKFPVFFSSQKNPVFDDDRNYFWLLADNNKSVALNFTETPQQWIVININGTGLYRVNYEDNDWVNLAFALNDDYYSFPTSTRAKLVSDAFAMLYAGKANIATMFTFLTFLHNEEELTPWLNALDGFEFLDNLLSDTDLKDDFDMYMQTILEPIYNKLGIDAINENNAQGILRPKIVSAMCNFGGSDCLKKTLEDFKKLNESDDSYIPNNDVRPVIVCNGMRQIHTSQDFMYMFNNVFDEVLTTGREIRKAYYKALACPQYDDPIMQFLDMIFDKKKRVIPKEDMFTAFEAIYSNPSHKTQAINYFVVNEVAFADDITLGDKINLMKNIAPYLTNENELTNLKEYLNRVQPPKEMVDTVTEVMRKLNETLKFKKDNHDNFKAAFQIINPPTTQTPISTTPTSTKTTSVPPDSSTTTTKPSNSTATDGPTTTSKPGSASTISIFSITTLILIFLGLTLFA